MGMLRAQEDCGNTDQEIDIELGLVLSITASLNMLEGLRAVTFERVKKAVQEDDSMRNLRDKIHQTPYDFKWLSTQQSETI